MTETNKSPNIEPSDQKSPRWGWTTKLVAGLALVALTVWILVQFQNFLGPIITAVILAYLIRPLANFFQEKIKIPWRISVTIIYIIIVLVFLGLITWGGLALTEQIQNLIRFINTNIDQLPSLVEEITSQSFEIGPFYFTLEGLNWESIANEFVGLIQPLLGQVGSFASSIASGAATFITFFILILLVSYFLLAESTGIQSQVLNIKIPGYTHDFERISDELNRIWNAFIRGEILVVMISLVIYIILLGGLGVQFFLGLAVIAALGQLIPYVGAWITWISFGLVALFQPNIPFNLPSGVYMVIVLAVSMVFNNIIDNIIRTKVMADNLKVHPALVLMGALIGVQLFGVIGIIIAAPVMASLKLMLNYVIKKLGDRDPWEELDLDEPVKKAKWVKMLEKLWASIKQWFTKMWKTIRSRTSKKAKRSEQTPDK